MIKSNFKILSATAIFALMILFANFHPHETNDGPARWHQSGHIFSYNMLLVDELNPYYLELQNAVNQWNAENSFLQFGTEFNYCSGGDFTPCDIAVSWINSSCDNYTANTQVAYVGDEISWAYINFDNSCPWVPNKPNSELSPNGLPYSFREVALHEIGHTLYLDHSYHEVAIMNYLGNFARLMPDDLAGLDYIYPSTIISKTDLSVSTQAASDDENHLDETYLGSTFDGNYHLHLQYTLLNLGTTSHNMVPVQFYLKSVSTGLHYPIDTSYFNMPARSSGTYDRILDVPNNIPAGDYKVWVKIDDNGQWNGGTPVSTVDEINENNNELPYGSVSLNATAINITGSLSDSQAFVGQNLTYQAEVCNASINYNIHDVVVQAGGMGLDVTLGNTPVTIANIQANHCVTVSFPVHVNGTLNIDPSDPWASMHHVCSSIYSYEPASTNFDLNGDCQPLQVIGHSLPNYTFGSNVDNIKDRLLPTGR